MNRIVHDLYHGIQHATLLQTSINLGSAMTCNYDPRGEMLLVGTSTNQVIMYVI